MSDTSRIKELQGVLEQKRDFVREGIQNGVKIEDGNVEVKSDSYAAIQGAMREIDEIKTILRGETLGTELKGLLGLNEDGSSSHSLNDAAGGHLYGQAKTLGEMFTKSEDFQHFKKTGRLTMDNPWEMEAKDMAALGTHGLAETKDIHTGALTGAVNPRGFGSVQFDPMVPRAQRTNRVRSLFPVAGTSANLIDYFRVLGFVENAGRGNAKSVAERTAADGTSPATGATTDVFGLKPKSNLRFQSAQAPVRTIAHWEAAHRNVLSDEPQLQATINNELLYGLALVEDDQILNGDGQGDNLLGILNTENIQTYAQKPGDRPSDSLRRAATLSVIANYPGTGFVLHPFDWEEIELQKATGDGQYMLVTNVAVGATTSVWRQPVVETPAMPQGQFLTGAFGIGAQLYDRQVASIRIAEQHEDFFVRNAIAILAEQRLALAVKRPEAFVLGTFAGAVTP